ncbi:MAG: nuclear transport factor 2 family protein [Streptococcaceae bacterium]|jgi:hypothetical protein|nr:nuclear transport factor 2 family protein [Streptococcaceae bacterium]
MNKDEALSLINRWALLADQKDAAGQVALFAPDFENSTLMPDGTTTTFTSAADLQAGITEALSAFPKTFHMNGQTEILGNHATSYCIAHHFKSDGGVLVMYIRYEDDFVEVADELKFAKRVLYIEQIEERS